MALYIGTPFNGAGTPYPLTSGDHFILQSGVLVYSTSSDAVKSSGGNNTFDVYGTIIGNPGIAMGDDGTDFGNRLFIGITGSVSGNSTAVDVDGGQATVINHGLIAGTYGVVFNSGLGTGSFITNIGTIISQYTAVYSIGGEKVTLVNQGTITSYEAESFRGLSAIDTVINRGTMNGEVELGDNHDTYNGTGGRVNGIVFGENGNDLLIGGSFSENLNGGLNNDRLIGQGGRDALTGGANDDVFDYNAVSESGITATTRDLIFDFNVGNDRIDLSTIDANTALAGNSAFALLAKGLAASAVGPGKIGWYWVDNVNNNLDRTFLRINNDNDVAIEMTIEIVGLKILSALPNVDFIF